MRLPNFPSLAREIVAKRVGILAGIPLVVTDVAAALNVFGVTIPTGTSDKVSVVVGGGINVLALLLGIYAARKAVTPADPALLPTAKDGTPLVLDPVPVAAAEPIATPEVPTEPAGPAEFTSVPDLPAEA